ncbi:hypothetical protein ACJX0J_040958 [Zea mays]
MGIMWLTEYSAFLGCRLLLVSNFSNHICFFFIFSGLPFFAYLFFIEHLTCYQLEYSSCLMQVAVSLRAHVRATYLDTTQGIIGHKEKNMYVLVKVFALDSLNDKSSFLIAHYFSGHTIFET